MNNLIIIQTILFNDPVYCKTDVGKKKKRRKYRLILVTKDGRNWNMKEINTIWQLQNDTKIEHGYNLGQSYRIVTNCKESCNFLEPFCSYTVYFHSKSFIKANLSHCNYYSNVEVELRKVYKILSPTANSMGLLNKSLRIVSKPSTPKTGSLYPNFTQTLVINIKSCYINIQ